MLATFCLYPSGRYDFTLTLEPARCNILVDLQCPSDREGWNKFTADNPAIVPAEEQLLVPQPAYRITALECSKDG